MTEDELYIRIGAARHEAFQANPDLRYREGTGTVQDNLSWLYWAWTDPDGQLASLSNEGAIEYRRRWRTALRLLRERSGGAALVNGIFYRL
jgi:hypothetical protein